MDSKIEGKEKQKEPEVRKYTGKGLSNCISDEFLLSLKLNELKVSEEKSLSDKEKKDGSHNRIKIVKKGREHPSKRNKRK